MFLLPTFASRLMSEPPRFAMSVGRPYRPSGYSLGARTSESFASLSGWVNIQKLQGCKGVLNVLLVWLRKGLPETHLCYQKAVLGFMPNSWHDLRSIMGVAGAEVSTQLLIYMLDELLADVPRVWVPGCMRLRQKRLEELAFQSVKPSFWGSFFYFSDAPWLVPLLWPCPL